MAPQKPILHGRDHANGGPDPIPGIGAGGGALEWEDVGSAGQSFVEAPLRYLFLAKYVYNDITGVDTPINFHVRSPYDLGYTPQYNTNDTTGGASDVGIPYNSAWSGDYFYSGGVPDGATAFKIRPKDDSMYLLEVVAYLYTGGVGDYNAWLTVHAPVSNGDTYQYGLAAFGTIYRRFTLNDSNDPRPNVSHQSLIRSGPGSGDIPVSIHMRQDSGSTSVDGPSVVMMRCVRLSPAH